jgi:hypothetical protein
MLTWLKERKAKRTRHTNIEKILAEAEGTLFEKSAVVAVMEPLMDAEFLSARNKLPEADRAVFATTFAICLTWAVRHGLRYLEQSRVEPTINAIFYHLTKQEWMTHEVTERVWENMPATFLQDINSPETYPLDEIFTAASNGGYDILQAITTDGEFGNFAGFTLCSTIDITKRTMLEWYREVMKEQWAGGKRW